MGIFYDPNNFAGIRVFVKLDTSAIVNLGSKKTSDVFIRDFVERSSFINKLVIFKGFGPAPAANTFGNTQLHLLFEAHQDVLNLRQGIPTNWVDCSTHFIDITPMNSRAVYLDLFVLQLGTPNIGAQQINMSLLI